MNYTPEYAEKPPSTGNTTPVIKPAASLLSENSILPSSSFASPNLPIGVAANIFPVLGVGVPSALNKRLAFCFVEKNPGAMAFTRIPTLEKCTASHCVKFDTAAFAPEYAGIFVSGVNAFILEIFKILQPSFPIICFAKICVGIRTPRKLGLNTNDTPSASKSKKLFVSASISPVSKYSLSVVALGLFPPAPFISKSQLNRKFRNVTGSTVWEYITAKRLILAKELLVRGEKPTSVYTKCGFNDYTSFYRAYKTKFLHSPKNDYIKLY